MTLLACGTLLVALYLPPLSDLISWCKVKFGSREAPERRTSDVAQLLFLVPAHDEEGHIHDCVRSLVEMDYPATHRRIVVVADNCHDETASRARLAGGECLEREDPSLPGKPRAIAWALDQLADFRVYDACVIIDADSKVHSGFAHALSSVGPLRTLAAQAYFDVLNPRDSWLTTLGKILATVRYEFAYALKARAGLNCPLTGNGMCIGTDLLAERGWTAYSLTENWELYAQYTSQGSTIKYVPAARLYSEEASSMSGGSTQRKRWLAGRLTVLRQWLPILLRSTKIGFHQKLDAAVELSNPGPVLYGFGAVLTALACLGLVGGPLGLAMGIAALAAPGPLMLTTGLAIQRQDDPRSALAAFARLPVYAVWRMITAIGTVKTWREGRWEKTERE